MTFARPRFARREPRGGALLASLRGGASSAAATARSPLARFERFAARASLPGAPILAFLKIIFLLNNPGKRENLIKNIPSLNPK